MLKKLLKKKKKSDAAEGAEGEEKKEEGEDKKEEPAKKDKKEAKEEPKEGEAKEGEEGAEGAEGEGAPKKGKQKIVIIAGAVVLIGVIVGVLFVLGVIGGGDKKAGGGHGEENAQAVDADGNPIVDIPAYYELPEFLVNLSSSSSRASFLKMQVTLELKDQASIALIDAHKPRILDTFNTYLRELRATDVQGSAGIARLKDELMTRINGTVQEGVVKDILFSEIIVQ